MDALDELPPLSELSEQQVRGTACVHCGIYLGNGPAVDLGARRTNRGGTTRWFPRACTKHGAAT